MVYIISNRITQWLCREDSLSEHYALILYGIQSLLNDCLKISLLFFLFAGFGKQKEFCVTLLGIGAMRRLLGGQHCKSFWRCFLCTLGILTVTVFLGDMVSGTLFWFMLPSFLTAGICIYFVGVVDTNGILTAGQKKMNRVLAILLMILVWMLPPYGLICHLKWAVTIQSMDYICAAIRKGGLIYENNKGKNR